MFPTILATIVALIAGALAASAYLFIHAVVRHAVRTAIRQASLRSRAERETLASRLEAAEADARIEHARMHEVSSTIAGITSANRLIHNPEESISSHRRQLLEDMVHSELMRLERLINRPGPLIPAPRDSADSTLPDSAEIAEHGRDSGVSFSTRAGPTGLLFPTWRRADVVDVDCILTTLLLAQHSRGRVVHWEPAGLEAYGDVDTVAEIVQVLLDNAACHGAPPVEVMVTRSGDAIAVSVTDAGSGLAPSVRARLFDWGAKGPTSAGQGIGLHIARRLAEREGLYLTMRDASFDSGTTFVLWLPATDSAHVDPERTRDNASAHLA